MGLGGAVSVKRRSWHLALLLVACVVVLYVIYWCVSLFSQSYEREYPSYDWVQQGDILFRLGRSSESYLVIANDDQGDFSHIGLAVEQDGNMMAAHFVPDEGENEYVKLEPIRDFFHEDKCSYGAVHRLPLDEHQKSKIQSFVQRIIKEQVPFDHEYDTSSIHELYCTEFVWYAFLSIGLDVSQGKRKTINFLFINSDIIMPSHIYGYPSLVEVSKVIP